MQVWLHGDRDQKAEDDDSSVFMWNNGSSVHDANSIAWTLGSGDRNSNTLNGEDVETEWDDIAHVKFTTNDTDAVNGSSDFVWVQISVNIPPGADSDGSHTGIFIINLESSTDQPTVSTFYTSESDGWCRNQTTSEFGPLYPTVRQASKANTVISTGTSLPVVQNFVDDPGITVTYAVIRSFVYFDTSSIPDDACILSATLSLFNNSYNTDVDFHIIIQNGQPNSPHDPLRTQDYYYDNYTGDGGSIETSEMSEGYNNIILNSSGLSWINKEGWTKLCLRTSRDINAIEPTGPEVVSFKSYEAGEGYIPRLVITYR